MRRRCPSCRQLLDAGSYCPSCQPWAADPGRVRGRRNQPRRAHLIALQGGRCARCGAFGVPLELHHIDHNPANNAPANTIVLCRRCHRLAGAYPADPGLLPTIPGAAASA
jgi:5-methylcytosine-specific restriction endonuclease McrA